MGQASSTHTLSPPPRASSVSPPSSPIPGENSDKPDLQSRFQRPALTKSVSMDYFSPMTASTLPDPKKPIRRRLRERSFKSSFRVFRRGDISIPPLPMVDARPSHPSGPPGSNCPRSPKFLRFWNSPPSQCTVPWGQMGPDQWHLNGGEGYAEYEDSHDRRSLNPEELWWSYGRLCHTFPGVLYPLPADAEEIERNDDIHHMYQYITGGDSAIRATEVNRVLDVGCGSGQWLRGMSHRNPQGQYVGVDIVDSRKPIVRANPNITLLLHNLLSLPLPLVDESFDMVHQQFLGLAITSTAWGAVLTEYHRLLRPNGWCEVIEGGLILEKPGPMGQRVNAYLDLVAREIGVNLYMEESMPQLFALSGLSQPRRTDIPCGVGSWAGPQGSFGIKTLLGLITALYERLCAKGVPQEELDEVLESLTDEVDVYETHTVFVHWLSSKPAQITESPTSWSV